MTTRITADAPARTLYTYAAQLLLPIAIWLCYAIWQQHRIVVVLAVAIPISVLSYFALVKRGEWKEIQIDPDGLTLMGHKRTVSIKRADILALQVRDHAIAIKWKGGAKPESTVLGKERFSQASWNALQQGLSPWVV